MKINKKSKLGLSSKRFGCGLCVETFHNPNVLTNHLVSYHNVENPAPFCILLDYDGEEKLEALDCYEKPFKTEEETEEMLKPVQNTGEMKKNVQNTEEILKPVQNAEKVLKTEEMLETVPNIEEMHKTMPNIEEMYKTVPENEEISKTKPNSEEMLKSVQNDEDIVETEKSEDLDYAEKNAEILIIDAERYEKIEIVDAEKDDKMPFIDAELHDYVQFINAEKNENIQFIDAEERPFHCEACPKTFKLKAHKKFHFIMTHSEEAMASKIPKIQTDSGEKFFVCELCHKFFDKKSKLVYHESTAHRGGSHQCNICDMEFKNKYFADKHAMNAHGTDADGNIIHNLKGCKICGKKFKSDSQLAYHEKCHTNEKPFQCENCSKAFKLKNQLKRHQFIMHTGIHEKYKKKNLKTELNLSQDSKLAYFPNEQDNLTFDLEDVYTDADNSNETENYQYEVRDDLSNGIEAEIQFIDVDAENILIDAEIDLVDAEIDLIDAENDQNIQFIDAENDQNIKFIGAEDGPKEAMDLKRKKSISKSGDTTFQCELCHKIFDKKCRLAYHKRTAHGGEAYQCNICDMEFQTKYFANKHAKNAHGTKTVKFHSINVHSKKDIILKREKSQIESGESRIQCELCHKVFDKKTKLEHHRKYVHNGGVFQCNICYMEFTTKYFANKHAKNAHQNLKCEICGMKFKKNYELANHLKTHLNEKPLKCEICPKSFKLRHQLKRHYSFKHPGIQEKYKHKSMKVKQNLSKDRKLAYVEDEGEDDIILELEHAFSETNKENKAENDQYEDRELVYSQDEGEDDIVLDLEHAFSEANKENENEKNQSPDCELAYSQDNTTNEAEENLLNDIEQACSKATIENSDVELLNTDRELTFPKVKKANKPKKAKKAKENNRSILKFNFYKAREQKLKRLSVIES